MNEDEFRRLPKVQALCQNGAQKSGGAFQPLLYLSGIPQDGAEIDLGIFQILGDPGAVHHDKARCDAGVLYLPQRLGKRMGDAVVNPFLSVVHRL